MSAIKKFSINMCNGTARSGSKTGQIMLTKVYKCSLHDAKPVMKCTRSSTFHQPNCKILPSKSCESSLARKKVSEHYTYHMTQFLL